MCEGTENKKDDLGVKLFVNEIKRRENLLKKCRGLLSSKEIESYFKDNKGTISEIEDIILEIDELIGISEKRKNLEEAREELYAKINDIEQELDSIDDLVELDPIEEEVSKNNEMEVEDFNIS